MQHDIHIMQISTAVGFSLQIWNQWEQSFFEYLEFSECVVLLFILTTSSWNKTIITFF